MSISKDNEKSIVDSIVSDPFFFMLKTLWFRFVLLSTNYFSME